MPEVTKKWEEALKKIASVENSKNAQSAAAKQMIDSYKQKINEAIKTIPATTGTTIGTPPPPIIPPPIQTPKDPLEPLKDKFSTDKVELIRRVFKSLQDNCPQNEKDTIKVLIKKAIMDLSK
ncbi:MAG: hypothetical protein LBQ31_02065 [Bacteroidales bacterium]|nr:hypothetical protein [Bacteroidales bacterium]